MVGWVVVLGGGAERVLGFRREWGWMNWWVVGHPGSVGGESGVLAVWRMLSGEWRMAMGGGCCVGAVVWEQVMLLGMVRWL